MQTCFNVFNVYSISIVDLHWNYYYQSVKIYFLSIKYLLSTKYSYLVRKIIFEKAHTVNAYYTLNYNKP